MRQFPHIGTLRVLLYQRILYRKAGETTCVNRPLSEISMSRLPSIAFTVVYFFHLQSILYLGLLHCSDMEKGSFTPDELLVIQLFCEDVGDIGECHRR